MFSTNEVILLLDNVTNYREHRTEFTTVVEIDSSIKIQLEFQKKKKGMRIKSRTTRTLPGVAGDFRARTDFQSGGTILVSKRANRSFRLSYSSCYVVRPLPSIFVRQDLKCERENR